MNILLFVWRLVVLPVICCVALLQIFGCELVEDQQVIRRNSLKNHLRVGEAVRLVDLAKISGGTICVLYPYIGDVADNVAQSSRINEYLKATGYSDTADEGHWAFVIIERDVVTLSKFKRMDLDVINLHTIPPRHKVDLPEGLKPVYCTSVEHAAIAKVELQNRSYIVLGETK
ncbi:MAG: hypothetical protein H7837_08570 [Magnetococcus sp. MYC-9]